MDVVEKWWHMKTKPSVGGEFTYTRSWAHSQGTPIHLSYVCWQSFDNWGTSDHSSLPHQPCAELQLMYLHGVEKSVPAEMHLVSLDHSRSGNKQTLRVWRVVTLFKREPCKRCWSVAIRRVGANVEKFWNVAPCWVQYFEFASQCTHFFANVLDDRSLFPTIPSPSTPKQFWNFSFDRNKYEWLVSIFRQFPKVFLTFKLSLSIDNPGCLHPVELFPCLSSWGGWSIVLGVRKIEMYFFQPRSKI